MGDYNGVSAAFDTGGGMYGCRRTLPPAKASVNSEDAAVVNFVPFGDDVNCDAETLAGKTWEDVADAVISKLNLGAHLSDERKADLKKSVAVMLRKENSNKARPFADYSDSNYLTTHCDGEKVWGIFPGTWFRSIGAPPSINLPVGKIYAAERKAARKEIAELKKANADMEVDSIVDALDLGLASAAIESCRSAVKTPCQIQSQSLDLFTLPGELIVEQGGELTLIVCGKKFSALPQMEVFGVSGLKVKEAALNESGELVVTVAADEGTQDPLAFLSITSISSDNGKTTLEQGDLLITVLPRAEEQPVAVAPPKEKPAAKTKAPKADKPKVDKPKVDKPKVDKPKTPKLPPCSDFPAGLQIKTKAQGRCE